VSDCEELVRVTWRVSDCEELVVPPEEASRQNYFMYQWAGACLPPGGQIRVQATPASELILYI